MSPIEHLLVLTSTNPINCSQIVFLRFSALFHTEGIKTSCHMLRNQIHSFPWTSSIIYYEIILLMTILSQFPRFYFFVFGGNFKLDFTGHKYFLLTIYCKLLPLLLLFKLYIHSFYTNLFKINLFFCKSLIL